MSRAKQPEWLRGLPGVIMRDASDDDFFPLLDEVNEAIRDCNDPETVHHLFSAWLLARNLDYIMHLNIDENSREKLERLTKRAMQLHLDATNTVGWDKHTESRLFEDANELIHNYITGRIDHHRVILAHISAVANSIMGNVAMVADLQRFTCVGETHEVHPSKELRDKLLELLREAKA